MNRTVYVIKCNKGYLCDLEKYTQDPYKAVTFVDYQAAATKLAAVDKYLTQKCHVAETQIEFPRKQPLQ